MKKIFILLSTLFLTGCMGSLLGGAPKEVAELDNFQVRKASPIETKKFDKCLYRIFKEQQRHFSEHRAYTEELTKLTLNNNCSGIQLSLETANKHYLVTARIRTGKSLARWTLNEKGEAVEHEDPRMIEAF